jgi:hypothetical protein
MGQVYQCWWTICREINVISSFEYYIFYVLYQFVTHLLTLLVKSVQSISILRGPRGDMPGRSTLLLICLPGGNARN